MDATAGGGGLQRGEWLFRLITWHHTDDMEMLRLATLDDLKHYDAWIVRDDASVCLWQSREWQTFQESLGRETRIYCAKEGGEVLATALVTIDRTMGGFSHWDCPRGPVWREGAEHGTCALLAHIVRECKAMKGMALTFSPVRPIGFAGSKISHRHEQPQATIVIDLTKTDDMLLTEMHSKCRYNIRLAEKKGVTVAQSNDIATFARLMESTAKRDGFQSHPTHSYDRFMRTLPGALLLLAEHEGRVVAGWLGVLRGKECTYYYGASDHAYRALMAPSLLQWRAMQYARERGARRYDLLGIDPPGGRVTAWANVTAFKTKFGGTVRLFPPEREVIIRPLVKYALALKRAIVG